MGDTMKIGLPCVRNAHQESVPLAKRPDGADSHIFTGLEGSLIVGQTLSETGDTTELCSSIESKIPQKNIQLIQSLSFGLDAASYVIAPGAMYDGNRMLVSRQAYCPEAPTEGVNANGPLLQVDIPRLTLDTNYRTEFAANAFTMPVVGIFDPMQKTGFLVGIEVYGVWGVTGVNLIAIPGEPISVEICLPVRRKRRYRFCDWIDADEVGMDLVPGQMVSGRVKIIRVEASSIPEFVTRVAEYGHEHRGKEPRRPSLSFTQSAALIEEKFNAYNWDEKNGFYRSGINPNARYALQTGWVSGGVTIVSMIGSENPVSRQRALRMLDVFCRDALSPSGYFHGGHDGEKWFSVGFRRPNCRTFSLVRRTLECTRDVLKCLSHLQSQGEKIQPHWESAARSNLDAACRTFERFGHLGYNIDFITGDVQWGDSTCGAFGIEPLVRGAAWFREARYLEVAEKLASYYCQHFLARGITCGGVGDALTAADSESNYALLAGLVHLHAATKNPQHLAWAREAADLFCTWVLSYDPILPEGTPLARLGIQARGAVFANTQNQHGAPGICTASGEALLALYEVTGEERYLRVLEDITQCIPQMIVQKGQEEIWGEIPPGSISERLMTMDGLEPNGHTAQMSTWPETSMLLAVRELPARFDDPERKLSANFEIPS
jgi:hypothetical protein